MLFSIESKFEVHFGTKEVFNLKDSPLNENTLNGHRVLAAACYFLASPYEKFDSLSILSAISEAATSGDLGRALREYELFLQNHPDGWDIRIRFPCSPIRVSGRSVPAFLEVGSAEKPGIFRCLSFGLYRDDNRMMNLPPHQVVVAHLI